MKEVEKGRTMEEFRAFAVIFLGKRARPMEKVVSLVRVRIRDSRVALPYSITSEELKPLKANSTAEIYRRNRVKRSRSKG